MENVIHILHLEDDPLDAELVRSRLADNGLTCRITRVQTRDEFEDALHRGRFDIILADYHLPMYDGMSALRLALEVCPGVPFIFVSGTMGEEVAIDALTQGATDYVLKQNLPRLAPAILRALEEARNRRERREAQKTLRRSNEMLRAIIEAAPTAIIGLDLDGNVHSVWNPAAEKMFGWSAQEVMGRLLPTVSPENQEEFRKFREQVRTGVTLDGVEARRRRRDGSPIDYSIYASPLHDDHGRISGTIAVLVDITDHKQTEYERQSHLTFFESMEKVNRAIQGAPDLETMMKDLLDVVRSIFDCDRAYLLHPCDPESPTWTVPMERTRPEFPGVLDMKQEMAMDPQLAEKLRVLLAARGPVVFGPDTPHHLPAEVSKQFNIKSILAMAVFPRSDAPWEFGIHQCSHVRRWTAGEKRIFEAIGRRLEDALTSLLTHRHLQKSEARYRLIAENTVDTICVFDMDLKLIYASPSIKKLIGFTFQEALVLPLDQILTPQSLQKVETIFSEQLALEDIDGADPSRSVLIELEQYRKDGSTIWVEVVASILRDENRQPTGILTVSRNITGRKLAEEALREKQDFIRSILDSVDEGFIVIDPQYRIRSVNRAFCAMVDATEPDVVGRPCYEISHRATRPCYESGETCPVRQTLATAKPQFATHVHADKNGAETHIELKSYPITDDSGKVVSVIETFNDVTENHKLQEQLIQSQKMESVGRLAGGVAHDFNNMLGVIMGYSEMALSQIGADNPLYDNLNEIFKAAKRSGNLTRQLLAFARKQVVTPKVLDLNDTVEGMIKMLKRLIGEDIDLVWKPGHVAWPVRMDPAQIDQIMVNLCVNARDAIDGVGTITIETGQKAFTDAHGASHPGFRPGEFLLMSISDDGQGMDKAILDKIFEPFFTTKERGKGTGLGLATVYGIVKQNNGFIYVYSEPGCGTTFRIYLPRHIAAQTQAGTKIVERTIFHGHETILLVEDDATILKITTLMLKKLGYRVLAAATPGEAIRIANTHKEAIDLLIADVVMPEMNGVDLANRLYALRPAIRHLYMSGYTDDFSVVRGILDEGVHFIQKPFSIQDIADKVAEVLGKN